MSSGILRKSEEHAAGLGSYQPPARTPTPPQLKDAVRTNARRHATRALVRVAVLLVLDVATVLLASAIIAWVRADGVLPPFAAPALSRVFAIGYLGARHFALALVIGLIATGNYAQGDHRRSPRRLLAGIAFAATLQLWPSFWAEPLGLMAARLVGTVAVFWLMLVASRYVLDAALRRVYAHAPRASRIILIGKSQDCAQMEHRVQSSPSIHADLVDVVETDTVRLGTRTSPTDELEYLIHSRRADTVIICGYPGRAVVARTLKAAMTSECQVLSWNPSFDVPGAHPELVWRNGMALLQWRTPVLRWWQMVLKRLLDVAVAALGLLVSAPLLVGIAAVIRLDSPGPVIFGQKRLGQFGRRFRCYKFRSMYQDAEARLRFDPALHAEYVQNGYKLPSERDTRITGVGRFLRKTSLDELPQLWNVLRGDMSLVGPRPIVPDELQHYDAENPMVFLSLKPGITGAWQVNGRSAVGYPERTLIELDYVERWSLATDLSILFRTIPAVLVQRGAH